MKNAALAGLSVLALASVPLAGQAAARDQVRVVGSSTVYPFTTAVAEAHGRAGNPTAVVESTGTGGGFKLFCGGVGAGHPDATNASRPITRSEFDDCAANGVTAIIELKIGFDGIVLANSRSAPRLTLTREQVFRALAREVPGPDGALVANPNRSWSDIDPALPATRIEVLGPPPTSGTRDAFLELFMDQGARSIQALAELRRADPGAYELVWKSIREDGAYVDAGENDNLIVQKLAANPDAVGIFGYSFLESNPGQIQAAPIDGTEPTFEAIADGSYGGARPLFVYFKKEHMEAVPGLRAFLEEYASEKAIGDDGYLPLKGLIPLPEEERREVIGRAKALATIAAPGT